MGESEKPQQALERAENAFWHSGDLSQVLILTQRILSSFEPLNEKITSENSSLFLRALELRMRVFAEQGEQARLTELKCKYLEAILTGGLPSTSPLLYVLGIAASYEGQFKQAETYFQKAMAQAILENSVDHEIKARMGLINVFSRAGDRIKLDQQISIVRELLPITNDSRLKQIFPLVEARILRKLNLLALATTALEQFYLLSGPANSFYLHLRGLFEKAELERSLGRNDQSKVLLELLSDLLQKTQFKVFRTSVLEALNTLIQIPKNLDLEFDLSTMIAIEKTRGRISFSHQFIMVELLSFFYLNKGIPASKSQIVKALWDEDYDPAIHDNKLYVTIRRLRELIEPDIKGNPFYIFRSRQGYFLSPSARVYFKNKPSGVAPMKFSAPEQAVEQQSTKLFVGEKQNLFQIQKTNSLIKSTLSILLLSALVSIIFGRDTANAQQRPCRPLNQSQALFKDRDPTDPFPIRPISQTLSWLTGQWGMARRGDVITEFSLATTDQGPRFILKLWTLYNGAWIKSEFLNPIFDSATGKLIYEQSLTDLSKLSVHFQAYTAKQSPARPVLTAWIGHCSSSGSYISQISDQLIRKGHGLRSTEQKTPDIE